MLQGQYNYLFEGNVYTHTPSDTHRERHGVYSYTFNIEKQQPHHEAQQQHAKLINILLFNRSMNRMNAQTEQL